MNKIEVVEVFAAMPSDLENLINKCVTDGKFELRSVVMSELKAHCFWLVFQRVSEPTSKAAQQVGTAIEDITRGDLAIFDPRSCEMKRLVK